MAPANTIEDTTPLVYKHPPQYRIAPRNWGIARQRYTNFSEEAGHHRDVNQPEEIREHVYFKGPVSCSSPAPSEIIVLGYQLQHHVAREYPLLRLRITESKVAGPKGTVSVKFQVVDKLKYSRSDYKKPHSDFPRTSTSKAASSPLSTIKLDDAPSSVTWCIRLRDFQAEFREPGSKTALNPAGTFVSLDTTLEQKLITFARESNERLKRAATEFAGVCASTAEEAEHAID